MRGFMLDSARCLESRSYYRRFIDFSAERGVDTLLWHFTDDQGCSLRFDCLPEAACPNAYSKAEMRELVAYARQRGITLVPELETLGHTRFITSLPAYADLAENDHFYSSITPVSERTRQVIGQMLDEVLDVFDSPLIHVGLDEVNFGEHPETRAALEKQSAGELFADYVLFLHARLTARGRRMMMWGDHLLEDRTIAPRIPKDILIANWHYDPEVPADTTQRLLDWGFEVVVCPALISHNQTLFSGEAFALPNLRSVAKHRELSQSVVGTITTIWTPMRFLSDSLWPVIDYAAAIMRDGPRVDLRRGLTDLAVQFYGFTATDEWLDAMMALLQRAPRRIEWLAAIRLDCTESLKSVDLPAELRAIEDIRVALQEMKPHALKNADSYERLLLLVDVMAHVWERAAKWSAGTLSRSILRHSEAVTQSLSQAWDHERFHDDPRKWELFYSFDEGNHLLYTFAQGTQVVRDIINTPQPAVMAGGTF